MLRLDPEQRLLLANKLADTGNLAAAALGFGQFLGDASWSLPAVVVGAAFWIGFFTVAVMLTKAGR